MSAPNGPLYLKTTELIRRAVDADSHCQYSRALVSYNEALKAISALLKEQEYVTQHNALNTKYCEYACRVSQLLRLLSTNTAYNSILEAAHEALAEARRLQAQNDNNVAMEFYVSGITGYQKILHREKAMHASLLPSNGPRTFND
ncbi:hypothetical protein GGI23_005268, partial [Coemansia sp. RSA 2559]